MTRHCQSRTERVVESGITGKLVVTSGGEKERPLIMDDVTPKELGFFFGVPKSISEDVSKF